MKTGWKLSRVKMNPGFYAFFHLDFKIQDPREEFLVGKFLFFPVAMKHWLI